MNISRLRAAKPPPDRIPMIENAIILTTNPLKFNTMPDGSFCVAFCPRNLKGELVIPSTVEFQLSRKRLPTLATTLFTAALH